MKTSTKLTLTLLCLSLTAFSGCTRNSKRDLRTGVRQRTEAESQVYEVVVRDFVKERNADSQTEMRELVFEKSIQTELCPGVERDICLSATQTRLNRESLGSSYGEAVEDFLRKAQDSGNLSADFHTDLPRLFCDPSVFTNSHPLGNGEREKLDEALRSAGGITSLSRIGFDHTLHFAIVSSSFYCGSLCGSGRSYILQKKWGKWVVIKSWTVWVS